MSITWKPEYSVNVRLIDAQHKSLVRTMNKLYEGIYAMHIQSVLQEVFAEIIDYANIHFLTEESLFDAFKFEGAEEHKKAHAEFKNKVLDLHSKMQSNEMEITSELVELLENWLVNHLAVMDHKYTKCFNEHGLF